MGWQDRGYNAGREETNAYFSNPLGLLQYALPIWQSTQLQIRLSFWLLLAGLFMLIDDLRMGQMAYIPLDLALLLGVCLWHELGHRVFAKWVGGTHWEWVLWPVGGMIAPTTPRRAGAVFVANVGGIVFNILLIGAMVGLTVGFGGNLGGARGILPLGLGLVIPGWGALLLHAMSIATSLCFFMILINLFPCYWFDGGHLWHAVLWPFLGQWKAGLVTCILGMILAVPLFIWALAGPDLFGMIMWGLVFYDCYRRRQQLKAAGEGMMEDEGPSYNYMDTPEPRSARKRKKNWFNTARKRALRDQAEQAKIDAILAKVKEKGLHSLNWWEKRTLKRATERQRQHDLANRP